MTKNTKAVDGAASKPSLGENVKEYWRSLRFEWAKISYPTKKQVVQSTTVVFVFLIAFIAVIATFDLLIGNLFDKLIF